MFATPIPAEVLFWTVNPSDEFDVEANKVKKCVLHPGNKPWIMYTGKDCTDVTIWDFVQKKKIFHFDLKDLLQSRRGTAAKVDRTAAAILGKGSKFFAEERNNFNSLASKFEKEILDFSDCIEWCGHQDEQASVNDVAATETEQFNFGAIRSCQFIDLQSVQKYGNSQRSQFDAYNHDPISYNDELKNKESYFENSVRDVEVNNAFHTETKILLLCEFGILFYDFLTKECTSLTSSHLNHGKFPTSAVFLAENILCVGCSDGILRIFEMSRQQQVKLIQGHTKGDIYGLYLLPANSNGRGRSGPGTSNSLNTEPKSVSDGVAEGQFRLLSIGCDGIGYVWDGVILGNIVQLTSSLPVARLQGNLGTKLTEDGLETVYVDIITNMMHIFSADRTLRVYDLDQLDALSTRKAPAARSSAVGGGGTGGTPAKRRSSVFGDSSVINPSDIQVLEYDARVSTGPAPVPLLESTTIPNLFVGDSGGDLPSSSSEECECDNLTWLESCRLESNSAASESSRTIAVTNASGVSNNYAKLNGCSPLVHHSRYQFLPSTYVLAPRTSNTLGIAQFPLGNDGSGEDRRGVGASGADNDSASVSDVASTREGGGAAGGRDSRSSDKLNLLHEINLSSLLLLYLFESQAIPCSPQLLSALAVDTPNTPMKIYSIQTHPIFVNCVLLSTSFGVILLSVAPGESGMLNQAVWGENSLLRYNTSQLLLQKQLIGLSERGDVEALPFDSFNEIKRQMSKIGGINSSLSSLSTASGSGAKGAAADVASYRPSFYSFISTSRPTMHLSLTGAYVLLHWSSTSCYILFRVAERMEEIERGQALAVGWIHCSYKAAADQSTASIPPPEEEIFALITATPLRVTALSTATQTKRRSSIFGGSTAAASAESAAQRLLRFQAPRLILKRVELLEDGTLWTSQVTVRGMDPGDIAICRKARNIFGGLLLCIVSPTHPYENVWSSEEEKPTQVLNIPALQMPHDDSKHADSTNVFLQLSLHETAQLQALQKNATAVLQNIANHNLISVKHKLKSTFFMLCCEVDQEIDEADDEDYERLKYSLKRVGPAFKSADDVVWDKQSGYAAVRLRETITLLRLRGRHLSVADHVTLPATFSPHFCQLGLLPRSQLLWQRGMLWVLAFEQLGSAGVGGGYSIHVLFTLYPFCEIAGEDDANERQKLSMKLKLGELKLSTRINCDRSGKQLFAVNLTTEFQKKCRSTPKVPNYFISSNLALVGLLNGCLLLAHGDGGAVSSLSLHQNKLVSSLLLLNASVVYGTCPTTGDVISRNEQKTVSQIEGRKLMTRFRSIENSGENASQGKAAKTASKDGKEVQEPMAWRLEHNTFFTALGLMERLPSETLLAAGPFVQQLFGQLDPRDRDLQ